MSNIIETLERRRRDLILTPSLVRTRYGQPQGNDSNEFFKINGSELRPEFLTVWPIIRDHKLFKKVSRKLSRRLKEIRKVRHFNRIVTCTPTMRYFLEEISFDFSNANDPVSFDYLGLHPMHSLGLNRVQDFSDRDSVMIITDVVSSGQLVDEMFNIVSHLGAQTIGSVAVFRTSYEVNAASHARFFDVSVEPFPDNPSEQSALFSARLVDRKPIGDDHTIMTIDRTTVYPRIEGIADSDFEPLVSFGTLLNAHDTNQLMTIGTFAANDKWMTLAFDIKHLLNSMQPVLTPHVLPAFEANEDPVKRSKPSKPERYIVSTPSHENREFVSFLSRQLKDAGYTPKIIYIPRSETLSEQYSYFTPEAINIPEGQTVYLCLATVSTSEKLRALSAYLAMSQIKRIRVLTLLNRMSQNSGSFLSRVLNLQTGDDRRPALFADIPDPSEFRYSSFLKVHDFPPQDLLRASGLVSRIVSEYLDVCNTGFFEAHTLNETKYFSPSGLNSASYKSDRTLSVKGEPEAAALVEKAGLDPEHVSEATVYAICVRDALESRKFDLVECALLQPISKELSYSLLRIVLLNASLLKITKDYEYFFRALIERIEHFQSLKETLVSETIDKELPDSIRKFQVFQKEYSDYCDEQVRCLATVAFLASLGTTSVDIKRIKNVLSRLLEVRLTPQGNVGAFMTSLNRILLWAITFAASTFNLTDELGEDAAVFAVNVGLELDGHPTMTGTRSIYDQIVTIKTKNRDWGTDLLNGAKAFLDEFELFFRRDALESQRLGLRGVLGTIEKRLFSMASIRHTFEWKSLMHVDDILTNKIARLPEGPTDLSRRRFDFRDEALREDVKFAIYSGVLALGQLQRAAHFIEQFIYLQDIPEEWGDYFFPLSGQSPFVSDCQDLVRILQRVRSGYQVTTLELRDIQKLKRRIELNVWSRDDDTGRCGSDLSVSLASHQVKLRRLMERAVRTANSSLDVEYQLPNYWDVDDVTKHLPEDDIIVFGDEEVLVRAIDNIFENVRHQEPGSDRAATETHPPQIKFEIIDENGHKTVRLTLDTFGSIFSERESDLRPTWQAQNDQLGRYGAHLSYTGISEPTFGARAVIDMQETPFKAIALTEEAET